MEKDKARLPQQRGRRRNAKRCMSRKRLILLVALLIVHTALSLIQSYQYHGKNKFWVEPLISVFAVFLLLGANFCLCYGKKKAACVQSILAVLAVLAALIVYFFAYSSKHLVGNAPEEEFAALKAAEAELS